MVAAATSRVDELCRLLESLTCEEAADFLDRCQDHVDAMTKTHTVSVRREIPATCISTWHRPPRHCQHGNTQANAGAIPYGRWHHFTSMRVAGTNGSTKCG